MYHHLPDFLRTSTVGVICMSKMCSFLLCGRSNCQSIKCSISTALFLYKFSTVLCIHNKFLYFCTNFLVYCVYTIHFLYTTTVGVVCVSKMCSFLLCGRSNCQSIKCSISTALFLYKFSTVLCIHNKFLYFCTNFLVYCVYTIYYILYTTTVGVICVSKMCSFLLCGRSNCQSMTATKQFANGLQPLD